MDNIVNKKSKTTTILLVSQILLLWLYLFKNIANIGSLESEALIILFVFVVLSVFAFIFKYMKNYSTPKRHLLVFFVIMTWVVIRHVLDRGDLQDLKSVTIGTTGGIILFYSIGTALSTALKESLETQRQGYDWVITFLMLCYMFLCYWLFDQYSGRIQPNIFYLEDVLGAYQRPGSFISISYIVFSYLFVEGNISINATTRRSVFKAIRFLIYSICTISLLYCAQAVGSNSATAVVLGVFFVSLLMIVVMGNKKIRSNYTRQGSSILRLKNITYLVGKKSILAGFILVLALMLPAWYFDFDVTATRVFGFGKMENVSLESRWEILKSYGFEQIAYAPIFGDLNVAFHVTGSEGTTLHNFMPNVWASLGLVGLIMISYMLVLVWKQFYEMATTQQDSVLERNFQKNSMAFYSFLATVFIFLYANTANGYSWPVIWFALGFYPIAFTRQKRSHMIPNNTTNRDREEISTSPTGELV